MTKRPSAELIVDATVGFRTELANTLAQQFPLIRPGDEQALTNYQAQDGMASFALVGSSKFVDTVISAALSKAADPSSVAFCHHGAKHLTFQPAIEHLQVALDNGTTDITLQTHHGPVAAGLRVAYQRLLVTGPEENVVVYMPGPVAEAHHLESMDSTGQARRLRRDCSSQGVPFGLMTGIYLGAMKSPDSVFDFFDNPQFADTLQQAGQDRPIERRGADRKLVEGLLGVLLDPTEKGLMPSMDPDDYRAACGMLEERGWLTPQQAKESPYDFRPVGLSAEPKAVFTGLTEEAQKLASPDFLDPARSEFINDQFGGLGTTRVVTAFLGFD